MAKAEKKAAAPATATETGAPASVTSGTGSMQQYLDRAVKVLDKFGISSKDAEIPELVRLLDEVKHLDEPKVLAISKTIQYMSSFNKLVRDNVENIEIGSRYLEITQMFDSIREDSKTLIRQLEDGRISLPEKVSNLWMKLRRGSPSARFDEIAQIYKKVARDTKDQLDREEVIMDGYIDFRFALKEAEVLAREVLEKEKPIYAAAQERLAEAQKALDAFAGTNEADKARLELGRDQARTDFENEDRTYQLLKDISENLQIGYDVGETLITKLKQTHDVKDRVFRRSVTFFTTNEHVFTILGTVYTSQHGLHEATQSHEAMKEGINKGIEDVSELGRELEKAAIKAGYGSTIRAESVQKLVDAISDYQINSLEMIADMRKESEENAKEIRRVVEEGKRKFQQTLGRYAIEQVEAAKAGS